ncbi:heterokaryon incompatibility protein-domain-containing protein [Cercophora scortea]|uniref:Heterokaryon incompatibility protein-domain-containing protein n=1 Tax=Cercophora scortea TaxID=314031 RepID=A0AAE0I8G3_9PEZI|nr:heterokaryon incompatibility protein-domain-containing protein [Cercophora scortea]
MGATLSRLWAALFHRAGRRRPAPLPFAYDKPLDDSCIRLLQFVRPRWFDFMAKLTRPQLIMATYPIDGLPKYVALSYTWGPPHQNRQGDSDRDRDDDANPSVVNDQRKKLPVQINGQTFFVFQNLKDALDGLYSFWNFDDDVQHLWIDAISINQDDLTERSIQVGIMDHIYRHAATTAVWLGRANADVAKAMRVSTALLRIPVEDFAPYRQLNPPPEEFWRARGLPCPDADKHWAPLVRLFQNRWFSRAWIIQEVTLSKKVVIICGHHGMTWDGLGHVAFVCHTARLGQLDALPAMSRYLSGEEGLVDVHDWVVHDPVGNMFQLWLNRHRYLQRIDTAPSDSATKLVNVKDTLLEDMRAMTGCPRDTASAWLMYLCLNGRCADATDPRDKVFSHLGLVNNMAQQEGLSPLAIHATYAPEIAPSHVYEQTMQLLVEETDSLAVLMALNDPPALRLASLPSWVPDLSRRQGLDLMWSIRPRFNAASNSLSTTRPRIQITNHRLLANSTPLATITTLSISVTDLLGPNWHQFTSHLLALPPMYMYPHTTAPETRIEAFWRTLLMNAVAKVHPAAWPSSPSAGAMFRAYVLQSLARYFPSPNTSTSPSISTSTSTNYQANINALALADPTGTMPSFHSQADLLSQIMTTMNTVTDSTANSVDDKEHENNPPAPPTQESVLAALAACVDRASAFLVGMDGSMVNRRIAFTDAGHVANVPLWAEAGDRLVVLDSCPCPLVLRPRPGTSGDQDEDGLSCFTLVGPAYVHGVMYGEAVGPDTVWERICIV